MFAAEEYDVYVGDQAFLQSSGKSTLSVGGGPAVLDTGSSPWTLTLTNCAVSTAHWYTRTGSTGTARWNAAGIWSDRELNVVLVGSNSITFNNIAQLGDDHAPLHGIYSTQDISLTGQGSLSISIVSTTGKINQINGILTERTGYTGGSVTNDASLDIRLSAGTTRELYGVRLVKDQYSTETDDLAATFTNNGDLTVSCSLDSNGVDNRCCGLNVYGFENSFGGGRTSPWRPVRTRR